MIKYKEIGKDLYELLEDYDEDGIKVAKGFKWNGASTPWWLRWLIRPTDKTKEASMVHDMLYAGWNGVTKATADSVFYKKLKEDGVNLVKAKAMHWGVKLFGFLFFKGK